MKFDNSKYFLAILVVCLMPSVARANIFNAMEHRLHLGSLENVVRQKFQEVSRSKPVSFLKSAVRNMAVDVESMGHSLDRPRQKTVSVPVNGFQWKSCGPADQLVDIRDLIIKPSPLYFPGKLTFGFDVVFHDTIAQDAQITANLKLQFRASSSQSWVTIPCVGQIGSCTYDDLCKLSEAIQCPPDLKQKGIPCTCPFLKGEYKLPSYDVEVDASLFPPGDYQGHVVLKDSVKGQIACYEVIFTVA